MEAHTIMLPIRGPSFFSIDLEMADRGIWPIMPMKAQIL